MAKEKKSKTVEDVVEEVKKEDVEVTTYTETIITRRGVPVLVRTYADGKTEEL